jgi:hypothetical protein
VCELVGAGDPAPSVSVLFKGLQLFVAAGHPGLGEVGERVTCVSSCESGSFTTDDGSHREPCTRIISVRRIANLGGHVIKGTNEADSS